MTASLFGCACYPGETLDGATDAPAEQENRASITVVPATDRLLDDAAAISPHLARVIDAARPTLGTPYDWGGEDLRAGVDCSNYTWLLHRGLGLPYRRYLNTRRLADHTQGNGLRSVPHDAARPGDLLVYGYHDDNGRWHGHIVILIDPTGEYTGHPGLALGSHGRPANGVQFVTYPGYTHGYWRRPEQRLHNVLRVEGVLD